MNSHLQAVHAQGVMLLEKINSIAFDSTGYRIGGVPAHLISGEFHYFRVSKADWLRR